jgi:hypothetical protein
MILQPFHRTARMLPLTAALISLYPSPSLIQGTLSLILGDLPISGDAPGEAEDIPKCHLLFFLLPQVLHLV